MSEVIDKIREKYPDAYKDVDDSELALRIGAKFPAYLERDPDFKNEFQQAAGQRSLDLALKGTGEVLKIITNPAAGEASEMGREQAQAERLSYGIEAPIAAMGTVQTMLARGAAASPSPEELKAQKQAIKEREDFEKLSPHQQLIKARLASAKAAGEGLKEIATTPLIRLGLTPEKIMEGARQFTAAQLGVNPDVLAPKASEAQIESALKKSPVLAASVGTFQAIGDIDEFFTSPLGIATLGMGALPATAQRMISIGFAAQMASQTPKIASDLGAELGKPAQDRDYQKIGNLVTSAIANTGFTVAGTLHAFEPIISAAREKQAQKQEFKAALSQMMPKAPATAAALGQQVDVEPEPVEVSPEHEAVGVVKREKIGAKDRIAIKTETGEETFEGSPKAIDAILASMASKTAEKPSEGALATEAAPKTETPASAQTVAEGAPIEKGSQDASSQQETAAVHGDLRSFAFEGEGEVPITQGGPRVQPQTEGRVSETPKPEASAEQNVARKIDQIAATDAEGFKKHVDDLRAAGSSMQQDAHRTGAAITTPEELEKVKAARAAIEAQVKALKEQIKAAKPGEKDALLDQFASVSQKGQWFNEVLEGALGSEDPTKAAIIKKDVGPDYKPPMQVVKGEEIQKAPEEAAKPTAPEAPKAPVAPETPEGATPTEDAVSKAFPDATYEQVKLAIQAVNEANYPEFSSRAEAIQKKYLQLATKAQTPDYGPFGNVKSAKALDELLSKPVPEKAPKPEEKPPGIRAAVMGEGPVKGFYDDGHFITLAIDAPSMQGITEDKIRESLPEELRGEIKKIERFKPSVVPGPKGAAMGPSKARMYFKTQEAAQKAFDYFKNAQVEESKLISFADQVQGEVERRAEEMTQGVPGDIKKGDVVKVTNAKFPNRRYEVLGVYRAGKRQQYPGEIMLRVKTIAPGEEMDKSIGDMRMSDVELTDEKPPGPEFKEGDKVWVGQEPMHREGTITGYGPRREGDQQYFVKTNLGEQAYSEFDIRPFNEGPAPAEMNAPGTKPVATMSDAELDAEIRSINAITAPLYARLEGMGDKAFEPKSSKYTPEAQKLHDELKPWQQRKEFLDIESADRARQRANQAMMEKRDKRVAEAPVYQRRNGWEIVKDMGDYVLRDPNTKEDVYRGKLQRVREVADESKPDATPAPAEKSAPAAPAQKYRIGENPTLYSILERLPQSEAEKANGEQPVRVRNENTGKEEIVMESDLKPVKERTAEEKAKKGEKRDLDQELRDLGMDPTVFKTKQEKQAAIIRENQKKQGPGTPHITQPADPKANISQLEESFRNVRGREVPISERVKAMFDLGDRLAAARDVLTRGVASLKVTGDYLIDKWKSFDRLDDFLKAVGDLSAEIEKNSWRMKQFVRTIEKNIPDKMQRAAIRKWVDAGGNMESLIAGFEEAPPEYKQHYLDAMDLSGDLLVGAMNIRNYFEARLQEAIDAGVLKEGVEDYIHRLYERNPEAEQRMLAYVQSGLLKTNPALIKKRIFDHDWEAERLGYRPVQDFLPAITTYESSLTRAIAAREFIRKIAGYEDANGNKVPGLLAADGRPVIDVAGMGIPLEDQNGVPEGTLIKPSGLTRGKTKINPATGEPEVDPLSVRSDYAIRREYPAFRNWKWVANDTNGNPIFVHGDVAIHPDFVHRFDDLLKPSQVRYNPRPIQRAIGRAALGVSSFAKQSLLDLSAFHQVQIAVHAAEHKVYAGVGPAPPGMTKMLSEINVDDPKMDGLLRGGLTLGGDYIYDPYYAEGLLGRSVTRMIPGLREVMESYHELLFQDIIPRIKATMAYDALERNTARYQKELQAGTMTMDDINHLTATQANAAFGGLNYRLLERSKTMQDVARIVLLAPDFLEARARFTAQAGVKFGAEQRVALMLGALTMWSIARVANMLISGQPHNEPDNLFSVVINGKAWGLRTVQGDLLHLAEHPIQFWMSRLNPVFGRTLLEAATGRDYFGRKRSSLQQVWDAASTLIPASLRFGGRERSWQEALFNAMGVTARRFSDVDDAFKLAQKWKDAHNIGMKGEFIYDPNKDDFRGLKVALSNGDEGGAAKELRRLLDSKKYNIPKINSYFDRYGNMPFTGSDKNDREWMKTLTDDEKKTVEAAREHKKAMRKLWQSIRDKYLQAQQHPEQLDEETNAPALTQ